MKKLLLLLIIPFLSFGQIIPTLDCNSIPNPGICDGYYPTFYFNQTTSQCEESYWGGCEGVVPFWTLEDCQNSCENTKIGGCLDATACNYNGSATEDDGSCTYVGNPCTYLEETPLLPLGGVLDDNCECVEQDDCDIYECNNPDACNYSPNAPLDLINVGCSFPNEYYDCYDNCINDIDSDGICDELEYLGCMDENACNYSDEALEDNGSCEYINDVCGGSFWQFNNGFLPWILLDYGIWNQNCECVNVNGCNDPEACNYNSGYIGVLENCAYSGESFSGYLINSGPPSSTMISDICYELSEECECCYRQVGDIYDINGAWSMCAEYICGCIDENACNYEPSALLSNNSCLYDDKCVGVSELIATRKILRTIDILGKQATNQGFQLHIYDDGSVEKKYVIK